MRASAGVAQGSAASASCSITVGLVLLLFSSTSSSGPTSRPNAPRARTPSTAERSRRRPAAAGEPDDGPQAPLTLGKGFAFLRIPRLGKKFDVR